VRADVEAIDAAYRKKRPLRLDLRGALPSRCWHGVGLYSGLFRGPSIDELAGSDQRECVGIVAALKIDRLVVGAVDMNHLAWI
jgi:hypothetical protein